MPQGLIEKQKSNAPDEYLILLDMMEGPPYVKMCPPTDEEIETLSHVILTSGKDWDLLILDGMINDTMMMSDMMNMLSLSSTRKGSINNDRYQS